MRARGSGRCGAAVGLLAVGSTVTCNYTGAGTYAFTAPAGVSSLDVTAIGAAGGEGNLGGAGGLGASVEDKAVPVSPGQALTVIVGGAGQNGTNTNGGAGGSPGGGGAGGDYPNGNTGAGFDSGGGGGYSGLLDPSGNPLVIAGGGGGGIESAASGEGMGGTPDGGNGLAGCIGSGCGGGGGGGSTTNMQGGSAGAGAAALGGGNGSPGAKLAGGQGGASGTNSEGVLNGSGGGGGGGFYGGGGGGGGAGPGAGGGGSSYGVAPGLTNEQTTSNAASVTITYTVPKGSQTITFTSSPPSPAVYGGSYTPAATGGASGNPVTFSIDSSSGAGVCSLNSSGTTVTFTGVGTCVIDANQAGNADYNAAAQQQQSFTVAKASQTITFTSSPPSPAVYGGSYTPAATGGASGNPVTF